MWILYAFGSALFAGITAILAKCGIQKTDSSAATAIRTIVVLAFAWLMVFLTGSQGTIDEISAEAWIFLILSGLSTGASWLCYFRALQIGDVNKVVPVDKSSTVLTILLAFLFLQETISWLKSAAVVLIAAGTLLMIQKKETAEPAKAKKSWLVYAVLSGQGGDQRSGIKPRHGHSHRRCINHGVDRGSGHGQAAHPASYPGKRGVVHLSVRACHRRLLAVLLPCTAGRSGKRGRPH